MEQTSNLERRVSLVWDTRRPDKGKQLTSPYFRFLDVVWRLHLYSRDIGIPYFWIVLEQEEDVQFDDEKLEKHFEVTTYIENSAERGFTSLVNKIQVELAGEDIWQASKSDIETHFPDLFRDDARWRIVCIFDAPQSTAPQNDNKTMFIVDQVNLDFPPDLQSLSLDFNNLLKNNVVPDVEFTCGDTTFPAHRAVLAARSKFFANLFRSMKMERVARVPITDQEAKVMDLFLKYIYTGNVGSVTDDNLADLYAVSDIFDVYMLKIDCSELIFERLTTKNCVRFLSVVEEHGSPDLEAMMIDFIKENTSVLVSDSWLEFIKKPSRAVIEIYRSYVREVSLPKDNQGVL